MSTVPFRHETRPDKANCAATGCNNPITQAPTGRPARFCSDACRTRNHRQQRATDTPITIEIDTGSATSRDQTPETSWLVRLRRANRTVIIATKLRRLAADRLAEQLNLLNNP